MKGKKLKIGIMAALLVAMLAMTSVPVAASDYEIVHGVMQKGAKEDFWVYEGQIGTLYFTPYQTGAWTFTTWHESLYHLWYADDPKFGLTGVDLYWKDMSNPNDQWHWWKTMPVDYVLFKKSATLYSGNKNIGYKFVWKTYSDGILVFALVQ